MRSLRAAGAAAVAVLSCSALLIATAVPASAFAGTIPMPLTLTSTGLAGFGATGATTAAAYGAGGTGTVVAGGTVAGGGALAAAAPVAVAAGGLAIGWGLGRFIGNTLCYEGVSAVCWPRNPAPGYVPNSDAGSSTTTGAGASGSMGYSTYTASGIDLQADGTLRGKILANNHPSTFAYYRVNCAGGGNHGRAVHPDVYDPAQPAFPPYPELMVPGDHFYQDATSSTRMVFCKAASGLLSGGATSLRFSATDSSYATNVFTIPLSVFVPTPSNPDRTWLTRGQCVSGPSLVTVDVSSVVWRGGDTVYPKYPDVTCPTGSQLKRIEVHKLTPSLSPPNSDVIVWEWNYPTDGAGQVPGQLYPECAGGACTLRLYRINPLPRLECFNTPEACRAWFVDPAKSSNFECMYGTHVMPLAECDVYRPTFDVLVEVDGGPKTETSPDPKVRTNPDPYANPDGSMPNPDGAPETDPGAESASCPPEFGVLSILNPFWYFKVTVCLFVPRPGTLQAGWDAAGVDWCQTGPGVLACGVSALVDPFNELGQGDHSDCLGGPVVLPVTLPGGTDGVMHPFQACGEPTETLSELWLGVSGGATYIGAFLIGARTLARTIGADDPLPDG